MFPVLRIVLFASVMGCLGSWAQDADLAYRELRVTVEQYRMSLEDDVLELQSELERLNSEDHGFEDEVELLKLEISSVRKELAHRVSGLENLEESFLHFQEFLVDAIDAQRSLLMYEETMGLVQQVIAALKSGDMSLADRISETICLSAQTPKMVVAEAYYQRGRISEWIGDYRLAFKHFEKAASINPAEVRYSKKAGEFASKMGYYAKAIRRTESAVAMDFDGIESASGKQSRMFNTFGMAHGNLGDYKEANSYLQLALDTAVLEHGEGSLEVSHSRYSMGQLYLGHGRVEEAISLFDTALASIRALPGDSRTSIGSCLYALGDSWVKLADYQKAESYYREAIEIAEDIGDSSRIQLGRLKGSLGNLYRLQARFDEALDWMAEALEIHRIELGEDHPEIGADLENISNCLAAMGKYNEALTQYGAALENSLENFGEDHTVVATLWDNIGSCWIGLGQYQKTLELIEKAVASDLENFSETHPKVLGRQKQAREIRQMLNQ